MNTTHNDPHGCDGHCDNPQHHAAYRRLLDAIEEVQTAAEAIRDLPRPALERRTHLDILDEAAGLTWVITHVVSSIEAIVLPCCWSAARKAEIDLRIHAGPALLVMSTPGDS
jgi:hypothetical protein